MMKCGCIGKKLTHSFSREIHAMLADYSYELIELNEEQIPDFFARKEFDAINVTIPYKQTVIPYLDSVSSVAQRIGAVNTIVNRNGKLSGYNTDYYGMKALLEKAGIDPGGKKVLILGTGGTSKTARVVAQDLGAAEIITVSRRRSDSTVTYEEAVRLHADAGIIINTTPVGMYPDCQASPVDISAFAHLEGVIDAVYNPLSTNLILEARQRGVKAEGGLYMLVMQAVVAVEKFLDKPVAKAEADRVFRKILASKENIVLAGTHGNAQAIAAYLLQETGFDMIETPAGPDPSAIQEAAATGRKIIVLGSAALSGAENVRCLRRNGRIYCLHPAADASLAAAADVIVPDMPSAGDAAAYILRKRMEMIQ